VIIFVGDKPSKKNVDPDVAFVGTLSYKRLLEWIWIMNIDISDVKMINISKMWKYEPYGASKRVIALGKNAAKAIEYWAPNAFILPHPSGLNRKLNDKKWLNSELKKCRKWLRA